MFRWILNGTFLVFLLIVNSCVSFPRSFRALSYNPKEQKVTLDQHHSYRVGPLSSDWVRALNPKPGIVFKNQKTKATLTTQAQCGSAFEDLSLHMLTKHLFMGLEKTEIVHQESLNLSGRDGLYTKARGALDGAPILLNIFVIKKDQCQFDFWAISSPPWDAETTEDFSQFVKGFEY